MLFEETATSPASLIALNLRDISIVETETQLAYQMRFKLA